MSQEAAPARASPSVRDLDTVRHKLAIGAGGLMKGGASIGVLDGPSSQRVTRPPLASAKYDPEVKQSTSAEDAALSSEKDAFYDDIYPVEASASSGATDRHPHPILDSLPSSLVAREPRRDDDVRTPDPAWLSSAGKVVAQTPNLQKQYAESTPPQSSTSYGPSPLTWTPSNRMSDMTLGASPSSTATLSPTSHHAHITIRKAMQTEMKAKLKVHLQLLNHEVVRQLNGLTRPATEADDDQLSWLQLLCCFNLGGAASRDRLDRPGTVSGRAVPPGRHVAVKLYENMTGDVLDILQKLDGKSPDVSSDSEDEEKSTASTSTIAALDKTDLGPRIQPYVQILSSDTSSMEEQASAAEQLINIAQESDKQEKDWAKKLADMTAWLYLLRGNHLVQEIGASIIGNLAAQAPNQDLIREAGGIPALVSLLPCKSVKVCEMAAAAVSNMAFSEKNQILLREAGSIPYLVKLLFSPSTAVQENAARALWYLAANVRNAEMIREHEGIPPLAKLLSSPEFNIQRNAAGALAYLAANSVRNQDAIRDAGAIPRLAALLSSKNDKVQEKSAAAFRYLGRNERNKEVIVKVGAIPLLVKLLSATRQGVQENAGGALGNLAVDDRNQEAIRKAGGIPPLVRLLEQCKSGAAGIGPLVALCNLCVDDKNKEVIVEAGGVTALVSLLRAPDDTIQGCAAGALQNLASTDKHKQMIQQEGAIPPLVDLLSSKNEIVQMYAAGTLRYLATNDENKKAIVESGAVDHLVGMLEIKARTETTLMHAVGTLRYLSAIGKGREVIKAAGALPLLEALRESKNEYVATAAKYICEKCRR